MVLFWKNGNSESDRNYFWEFSGHPELKYVKGSIFVWDNTCLFSFRLIESGLIEHNVMKRDAWNW